MKLLIFSDIHSDKAALERLMDTEADHYIAAGDMVNRAGAGFRGRSAAPASRSDARPAGQP